MTARQQQGLIRPAIFVILAAALFAALPALAQPTIWNLRTTDISSKSISIRWENGQGSVNYLIYVDTAGGARAHQGYTTKTSYRIKGLRPRTRYVITVYHDHTQLEITARTKGKPDETEEPRYTPPPVTCPHLPPGRAIVTGFVENTQCQMAGEVVISNTDLAQHDFVDAVDVWNYVNGGLEICFRNEGSLYFLDAAYAPREVIQLEQYQRDGMTCGSIDRAGTVVLLRETAPAETSAANESPATLPTFDSIPLSDCQIKLVETLFLRAEPAGEIIGLVWLNSEVPAFEINGYWYKVEFEGKTGYISRYHRKVLRGGCG